MHSSEDPINSLYLGETESFPAASMPYFRLIGFSFLKVYNYFFINICRLESLIYPLSLCSVG